MSRRLLWIALWAGIVIMGCAQAPDSPMVVQELPTLPVITLGPTATFVPTLSGKPTATRIPTVTPTPIVYVVKKGDILGKIAVDHNISLEALMAANGLQNAHLLSIGQRLIIPNQSMLSQMAQAGLQVSAIAPTVVRPTPTLSAGAILWDQAADYVGAKVAVEGLIVRTRKAGGSVFLFYADPPQTHLRCKIPPDAIEGFSGRPEADYLDRWIRVEGSIERAEEGLQIIVRESSQVLVLD